MFKPIWNKNTWHGLHENVENSGYMQRYSIIGDLIKAGFGGVIPVNNVTQKQNPNLFLDFVLGQLFVCIGYCDVFHSSFGEARKYEMGLR